MKRESRFAHEDESNQPVELSIREATENHGPMVEMTCQTIEECQAYHAAIREVLRDAQLNPILSLGVGQKEDVPGKFFWEVSKTIPQPMSQEEFAAGKEREVTEVTTTMLETLLPKIHSRAQKFSPIK